MTGLRVLGLRPRFGLGQLDLDIAAGSLVLVSGPSGAGKSLLLRAIADLDLNQGEVWLGRAARSRVAPAQWRQRVGLLLAESGWWAELVGDHFPPDWTMKTRATTQIREQLLGALGFASEVLGWPVARLSTGERQRLALARLLANQPQALLLDEPTANLDPANRDRVERVILSYQRQHQVPVLWVSHDQDQRLRLSEQCAARRLWIADGALVDEP